MFRPKYGLIFALVVFSITVIRYFGYKEPARPRFVPSTIHEARQAEAPFFFEDFINPASEGQVHVASICQLSNGDLVSVWYAGHREGSKDTVICLSKRSSELQAQWSTPKIVVDRWSVIRELKRYIKKLGNPLIYSDSEDRLWLFYVSVTVGGWSGSSLNWKVSTDGGETWSDSRRLSLSPFFNVSTLVRNNPIPLDNGAFCLPIYHEFLGCFSELLWFEPGQENNEIRYHKRRITWGRRLIQPALAALDTDTAVAFFRYMGAGGRVHKSWTRDAGMTWSAPEPIGLPNPNAGINVLPISGNRLLLAFNNCEDSRENLTLAVANSAGNNWKPFAVLESTPGGEFSYPYMIGTEHGIIHLVYTWMRQRIKYLTFNEGWIEGKIKEGIKK